MLPLPKMSPNPFHFRWLRHGLRPGIVLLIMLSACSGRKGSGGQVLINEFLTANNTTYIDDHKEQEDWVEIYNPSDTAVDMGGMYFTDNPKKPLKWRIPDDNAERTTVPANGHKVFWFDKDPEQGADHVNFKLKQKGEHLCLYARDGATMLDQIKYEQQHAGISYGRAPDGGKKWSFFELPSPGESNPKKPTPVIATAPTLKLPSGFYDKPPALTITLEGDGDIYYTTDGSWPTLENGDKYVKPLILDSTTVVRARTIAPKAVSSRVVTGVYFIDERDFKLPVISVVATPYHLRDEKVGHLRFRNRRKNYAHPCHVTYFDQARNLAFDQGMNLKLQGRFSRRFRKKSFTIKADNMYGPDRIAYKVFDDQDIESFDGLVLRADCNYAGFIDDEKNTAGERIRNELMYMLNKQMGSKVIMQAYQPAVFFLNGEYFGLYNVMERKNKDFIKNHYGISKIDMVNPAVKRGKEYVFEVYAGDRQHYDRMVNYLAINDMEHDSIYERLDTWVDFETFIDVWVYEVWHGKGDHLSNSRLWRPRTEDGKWESISFDHDHWKEHDYETLRRFMNKDKGKTWLFNRMIKNPKFRARWSNRMCDYLNTVLLPENVHRLIMKAHEAVAEEKMYDRVRWEEKIKYVAPFEQINWMKKFAELRPDHVRKHMVKEFKLKGTAQVTFNVAPAAGGYIHINTIDVTEFPWQGIYMQGIPVTISAIPNEGYRFKGWSDPKLPQEPLVKIDLGGDYKLNALFEKIF